MSSHHDADNASYVPRRAFLRETAYNNGARDNHTRPPEVEPLTVQSETWHGEQRTDLVNLVELERKLNSNPLREIARLVKALTYGEMMDLSKAVAQRLPQFPSYMRDEMDTAILPGTLHRWCLAELGESDEAADHVDVSPTTPTNAQALETAKKQG